MGIEIHSFTEKPAMPIYEFYSPKTHKIYSFFARNASEGSLIPRCPDGNDYPMERLVSSFAVTGKAREEGDSGGMDGDDQQMNAAMAEMEKAMASLDEENPDPRKMGEIMRKMSDMTGEKMPPIMEEMISRLEAGEDPEKLEEEFGDLADMDDDAMDLSEGGASARKQVRRTPSRDPELYEMKDYLE